MDPAVNPLERPVDLGENHGTAPVRCFTGEALMPEPDAERQLRRVAAMREVTRHVAVLPDVHFKARNPTPSGTVVVTRDALLPRAIDGGTNCGIRVVACSVERAALDDRALDTLFARIQSRIPLREHETPLLDPATVEDVLVHGVHGRIERLGIGADEGDRCENGGRLMADVTPDEIRAAIPEKAIKKAASSLGTVGPGNHFLELQEVVEVLDESAARAFGFAQGRTCLMIHCDARRIGNKIMKPIRQELEAKYRPEGSDELWTIPADSPDGRRYRAALAAASHAAWVNRALVTAIVRRALVEQFGEGATLQLVYDCGHETIQRETHYGEALWVHRHGASHARPATEFPADSTLGAYGQPVPIAGSMGTDSYVACARPGVAHTFHSVAHGAGRMVSKEASAQRYTTDDVEADMARRGVRLYRYGRDEIGGQAPASFKDAALVIRAMVAHALIQPVVRVRPIAVQKG